MLAKKGAVLCVQLLLPIISDFHFVYFIKAVSDFIGWRFAYQAYYDDCNRSE